MAIIRLLGPPAIETADGGTRSPRGRKAWALLGYVLLTERPQARRHLAELFFGDAEDPLGAVRWTLAELRRALGAPHAFTGDPVAPALGDGIEVDVHRLMSETPDAATLLAASGELLDGVSLGAHPEFDSWLLVERHRVSAMIEARCRERAAALLASGRAGEAIPFASRTVALNPLEEGNHGLLVRSFAMAGDRAAARRQVAACEDVLRRDAGIAASPALREAATVGPGTSMVLPLGGRASAMSQLEAGRAAIVAGAVDAGVQCLRRAVAEATACKDVALQARALAALGSALVHSVRGRDEEGTVVLHEAIEHASRAGDRATAVNAYRELGFIEVQAGRRATAEAWLGKAATAAESDNELAAILGVRGMNASDFADYPKAFAYLNESVERADRCGNRRQQAWSLGVLARAHVLRAEDSQAAVVLEQCLDLIREQRWIAFLPWPQALRAEVDLRRGDTDSAAEAFEQAWALALQLDDPCWEGMAGRGLSLLHARCGDQTGALQWIAEATFRSNRVADRYQWVHGHVLETAIDIAITQDDADRARSLLSTLDSLAARCDMRELVVRAHLHRARLSDGNYTAALAAARLLAAQIDNPALHSVIERR